LKNTVNAQQKSDSARMIDEFFNRNADETGRGQAESNRILIDPIANEKKRPDSGRMIDELFNREDRM
jgi:hypothetical protein